MRTCQKCMHRPACEQNMKNLPTEGCSDYEREIAGGAVIVAMFSGIVLGLGIGAGLWFIFQKLGAM